MKTLLTVTAAIEVMTGLVLIAFPSMLVMILLGSSLDGPAALTIARIAGVAILTLGSACWLSRNDSQGKNARRLVTALAIYNIGTIIVLIYAGLGLGLSCFGLWGVVMIHAVMGVWCSAGTNASQ
jgi:hypothetical protein